MKLGSVAFIVAVVLGLTMSIAVAQRGRGGPGMGPGGSGFGPGGNNQPNMPRMGGGGRMCGLGLGIGIGFSMANDLGLSANQITQLQKVTDKFLADTKPISDKMQVKAKELSLLWTAKTPNKAAIKSKIAEMDQLRAKLRNSMVDRTFSAMKVLTAAQKTKLRDLVVKQPGFGAGLGCGLGMGFGRGGNCYMMGGGSRGMGGGRGNR
ncbi:MAG: Spy/CpxP family protein refolding chaperone [bacterium]